jgi:hypothetical protein
VTPLARGGVVHLWRDNDAPGLPWRAPSPPVGAAERFAAASLVESNFGAPGPGGNLELLARTVDGRNLHYWRIDGPPWAWSGPTVTLA